MHLLVIFGGITSLLVPGSFRQRHFIGLSAFFNNVCNRLLPSWLLLYAAYFYIQATSNPDTNFVRNLLFCFPEAVKSPFGFIGLCSAVCCASSLVWSSAFYIFHGSFPVHDDARSAIYGFFIVLHMILLAIVVPQLDDVTVPQMAPFFVVKVLAFHVSIRLLQLIDSVILSSDYSGTASEDNAFFILHSLAYVPAFVFRLIEVMFNNSRLAAWASFPVCLTRGFILGTMVQYFLRISTERLRGWLWSSEGNMDVFIVVSIP
jgi:hypothetical protein